MSLFTSLGTLLCCALPALLVTLGLGASLAGLISKAPWLTALSEYKEWVFGGAALMLISSGFLQWRARYAPCPADVRKAKACSRLRKLSWWIFGVSVFVYLVGFFFAFLAVEIFYD
ncbi:MAG: hypothetical protein AAGB46_00510 [Verrucomicrobiota bacterium]